jgi:hypothetical protein
MGSDFKEENKVNKFNVSVPLSINIPLSEITVYVETVPSIQTVFQSEPGS